MVSSNQQSLHKELEHIRKALQACHFPTWTLNKLQQNYECKHYTNNEPSSMDTQPNNNKNISIVVPYIQGLGERFKRTCNNRGIQVHFKGTNTIKTLLMAPKDRDNKLQKNGVIYKFKCQISLFADIRQPCQYICLKCTHWNQQCDQKHWYSYNAHYQHKPLKKSACHTAHIHSTALLL